MKAADSNWFSASSRHDEATKNAANIVRLAKFSENIAEKLLQTTSGTQCKILHADELSLHVKPKTKRLAETHKNNWDLIEDQFDMIACNISLLRDCTQLALSRQQMNFIVDTVTALLTMTRTNNKTYSSVLYVYQLHIMDAIPTMLGQFSPKSLVSRQSLLKR